MDKIQIIKFINKNRTMQLATVDSKGQPHTRALALYDADDSGIIFHTGTFKPLYNELSEKPRVEASFFDPVTFSQVRIKGTAREISEQSLKEKIVNTPGREFLKPWVAEKGYEMMAVFKIEHCIATNWTMAANFDYPKKEIVF